MISPKTSCRSSHLRYTSIIAAVSFCSINLSFEIKNYDLNFIANKFYRSTKNSTFLCARSERWEKLVLYYAGHPTNEPARGFGFSFNFVIHLVYWVLVCHFVSSETTSFFFILTKIALSSSYPFHVDRQPEHIGRYGGCEPNGLHIKLENDLTDWQMVLNIHE